MRKGTAEPYRGETAVPTLLCDTNVHEFVPLPSTGTDHGGAKSPSPVPPHEVGLGPPGGLAPQMGPPKMGPSPTPRPTTTQKIGHATRHPLGTLCYACLSGELAATHRCRSPRDSPAKLRASSGCWVPHGPAQPRCPAQHPAQARGPPRTPALGRRLARVSAWPSTGWAAHRLFLDEGHSTEELSVTRSRAGGGGQNLQN